MYDEADINSEAVILCAASAYEQKYYLNENFSSLPQAIKDELQIMCVLYTAEIGGIFSLQYDEDGNLYMNVVAEENDFAFDEIGSALKIKALQNEKRELLESLEKYYKLVILHQTDDLDTVQTQG